MAGRNVIVTGASPNCLGYETARILASWGASVAVTSVRDVELMENSLKDDLRRTGADGNNITAHSLDLSDAGSVSRFATWYDKNHRDVRKQVSIAGRQVLLPLQHRRINR